SSGNGGGERVGLALFTGGKDLFDNGGSTILAELARGIIDAALGESELAAAGAFLGVEFVEGCLALLGGQLHRVDAGEHSGAIGVFQKDFTSVLERFDPGGNGQVEEGADFGFVEGGIEQSDVLLNDAAFVIDDEKGWESENSTIVKTNLIVDHGYGEIDAFGIDDLFHRVRVIVVGQADDLQAFLVAILEFDKAGNFRAARAAPGGPKIQEDDFALCRGQGEILARQILELKIGGWIGIAHKADYR